MYNKLSYTDLYAQYLRNIGKAGAGNAILLADFNTNLGARYQMVLAKLSDYMTQIPASITTVASTQYYSYPPAVVDIESVVVDMGSYKMPLTVVNSQARWDFFNVIQIQPSAIPQLYFPRRDDFGIWPIPNAAYTVTFNHHYRDRPLIIDDYNTGTISTTNASAVITGSTTTFASYMVGMWLVVTDSTKSGWGRWYRIGTYTSATSISLERTWVDSSISGATYRIANVPEIPDEGHIILVDGVTADYYAGLRNDMESANWFNNRFWTGDGANPSRDEANPNIKSGLIGLANKYTDRNSSALVNRRQRVNSFDRPWAYSIV